MSLKLVLSPPPVHHQNLLSPAKPQDIPPSSPWPGQPYQKSQNNSNCRWRAFIVAIWALNGDVAREVHAIVGAVSIDEIRAHHLSEFHFADGAVLGVGNQIVRDEAFPGIARAGDRYADAGMTNDVSI